MYYHKNVLITYFEHFDAYFVECLNFFNLKSVAIVVVLGAGLHGRRQTFSIKTCCWFQNKSNDI